MERPRISSALARWLGGAAVGLLAGLAVLGAAERGLLEPFERRLLDRVQRLANRSTAPPRHVLMAYVDDKSLAYARGAPLEWSWPWPRSAYEPLLHFCRAGGARAVVFDILFDEPSRFGAADDEALGAALRASGNGFLVLFFTRDEQAAPPEARARAHLKLLAWDVDERAARAPALEAAGVLSVTVAPILEAARGAGNAVHAPDEDGVYRAIHPLVRHEGRLFPTIGLAVAREVLGAPPVRMRAAQELAIGDLALPLEPDGRLLLRFHGGVATVPHVSAGKMIAAGIDLLEARAPELDPSVVKDKVVIVAYSAAGLYDVKPNPVDGTAPAALVHAAVVEGALRGEFLRSWTRTGPWPRRAALLGLAGAIGGIIAYAVTIRLALLVVAAVGLGWLLAALVAFRTGLVVDVIGPELAILLAFAGATAFEYALEGRQRRRVRDAFEHYLAPALVDELLRDPKRLRLGGERRELTIFFSDLAGFTTISEKLEPRDLVSLLNEYLTVMTGIILRYGGTHDKYEGDAIMCFFGAPLELEGHAARCCLAALEQQEALAGLNASWAARGLPRFHARMGANTGPVIVGNIGSETTMDYTVIGDSVNLASRLEGANKAFGTAIMVGERTRELAGAAVEARELGGLRVKGKTRPVRVYELLGPGPGSWGHIAAAGPPAGGGAGLRPATPPERVALARRFEAGLRLYETRDFAGALAIFEALGAAHDDPPSKVYAEECRHFLAATPGPEWDGVITLTSK